MCAPFILKLNGQSYHCTSKTVSYLWKHSSTKSWNTQISQTLRECFINVIIFSFQWVMYQKKSTKGHHTKCGLNIQLSKLSKLLDYTSIQGFWPLCPQWLYWFQTTKPNSKATARAQLDFRQIKTIIKANRKWCASIEPTPKATKSCLYV